MTGGDVRPPVVVVGLLGGRPVGADAEAAVRAATLVAGSADQLSATEHLRTPDATTAVVGAGLGALDAVAAHDGPTCVLASGDPSLFGIARALRARLAPSGRGVVVHPAPSSVSLAFARAGLAWDGAVVRSCHTGVAPGVIAELAVAPVAAVLCGPEAPPEVVAAALLAHGASHPTAVVASHLGEPQEEVTVGDLHGVAAGRHPHRSVLVISHGDAAVAPAARPGGRPVDAFAHRAGMITKPEVRSVVLGKLDLPAHGVLWDLGAGSASVAIEAALAARGLRAIAVERQPDDAERAVANAAALGALVEVVTGRAPDALDGLPDPDRVFVGGGGLDVLDAAWARLRDGGRLVATFAAVDRAAEAHRRLGSLVQVSVDRADTLPDGGVRFAADNPVFVAWGDKPARAVEAPAGDGVAAAASVPVPARVAVGVGCSTHATEAEVAEVVDAALAAAGVDPGTRVVVATVDRR
ncbi:MAG TPA: precorrin-6y C5,15-methyltransferase (decarboxylating) subunit CbiE, partial [Aquihabitans sp.]|nr:precorrin-6y C5,15-methyltransferase (decarboxylating) subunit CbiE [Aquihabitans sp.]